MTMNYEEKMREEKLEKRGSEQGEVEAGFAVHDGEEEKERGTRERKVLFKMDVRCVYLHFFRPIPF
jgi:hypothetical protein